MSQPRTFIARWVFPVSGPPLGNGTITIRGETIESVDAHCVRTPDEDLGNAAIVPGFVNPHTHLDLSGARGLIPLTDPDHFTDWLRGVIAYRRSRTPEQVQADIRAGLAECMRFGTTLIGDIAAEGASWDAMAEAKVRAVVFWELLGLSEERFKASWEDWAIKTGRGWDRDHATVPFSATSNCRWGASPHAPFSVNHASAKSLMGWPGGPKAMHLAESPDEMELLDSKGGPFVPFLQELGVWNPNSIDLAVTDFLWQIDPTRSYDPRLFIHCNYLPSDAPFAWNQSIVYCPRTHGAFRHPPHPFREFLQRRVRVCLGTDSLASNPDLDILAEARFVHEKYPDFPGDSLLKMITSSGAEALGWADETGSLEPGKSADFVVVPLPSREANDPHGLLFADHPGDRRTMFRGEWRD